jgi:uncharacterized membrane protein YkvA (DUF1232 family)
MASRSGSVDINTPASGSRAASGSCPKVLADPRNLKEQAETLRSQVWFVLLILKDGRTPWYAKAIAACSVGYVFSPIQLIPSFIPVIGLLDDFLVLWVGLKLTHALVPETVIRDCRERGRRYDQDVSPLRGWAGAAAIVALWLMLMVAGTFWLYKP